MGDTKQTNPNPAAEAAKEMTAIEAAKLVRRKVVTRVPATTREGDPILKDGKPLIQVKTDYVAIKPSEVLSFKDYGSHVVVVTNDGQKFSSADKD